MTLQIVENASAVCVNTTLSCQWIQKSSFMRGTFQHSLRSSFEQTSSGCFNASVRPWGRPSSATYPLRTLYLSRVRDSRPSSQLNFQSHSFRYITDQNDAQHLKITKEESKPPQWTKKEWREIPPKVLIEAEDLHISLAWKAWQRYGTTSSYLDEVEKWSRFLAHSLGKRLVS